MNNTHYTHTFTPGRLIIMAWPEAPVKTDGNWYDYFFEKYNNNVSGVHRLGHAAISVVNLKSGKVHYFDFGRYIIPEGKGRARSEETDPDVAIEKYATVKNNKIVNLKELLQYMAFHEPLHGSGPFWATVPEEIVSVEETIAFVRKFQEQGDIDYGPFKTNGSNCSRFVCDVAKNALKDQKKVRHLKYPVSLTPSPLGNIFSSSQGISTIWKVSSPNKIEAVDYKWAFPFIDVIKTLFISEPPESLSTPKEGTLVAPKRLDGVPKNAQWLSGLGAGAWFSIQEKAENNHGKVFRVRRFSPDAAVEFDLDFICKNPKFDISQPYQIQYNTNARWCHLQQNGELFKMVSLPELEKQEGKHTMALRKAKYQHKRVHLPLFSRFL